MPTYKVERDLQTARVVDAKTPGAARAHVAKDELKVTKITVTEAFALAQAGATLETAGEEEPDPQGGEGEQDED